jgi:hypothetical protein
MLDHSLLRNTFGLGITFFYCRDRRKERKSKRTKSLTRILPHDTHAFVTFEIFASLLCITELKGLRTSGCSPLAKAKGLPLTGLVLGLGSGSNFARINRDS